MSVAAWATEDLVDPEADFEQALDTLIQGLRSVRGPRIARSSAPDPGCSGSGQRVHRRAEQGGQPLGRGDDQPRGRPVPAGLQQGPGEQPVAP